jgi:hypothetical protein
MLFGVQPLDLPTFALVTMVLGVTTALAIAARRCAPRGSIQRPRYAASSTRMRMKRPALTRLVPYFSCDVVVISPAM